MPKDYDKPSDKKLDDSRKEEGHKYDEGTLEFILGDDRKDKDVTLYEKMLSDARKGTKPSITEGRLNSSSDASYPHRNEKAWTRTKEKRPVNALPEEMGDASDAGKVDRYEASSKSGDKRVVDKGIGTQRKAYNRQRILQANSQAEAEAIAGEYLNYKSGTSHWAIHMAEAKELDSMMAGIMGEATKRALTDEEKARIEALKRRKSEVLRVAAK